MAGSRARRASAISPYEPYLWERWTEGCQNAHVLWHEIQAQGFSGSYVHLRRALRGWRTTLAWQTSGSTAGPPPPSSQRALRPFSPRQAAWLLLRPSETLQAEEQLFLDQPQVPSGLHVQSVQRLAVQFGHLVRRATANGRSSPWLRAAEQSGMPELHGFASGLRRDLQAVTAAMLKWQWSNGQTEGQVNRLKTLKRAMYGRAKLDLLRLRLLYAA